MRGVDAPHGQWHAFGAGMHGAAAGTCRNARGAFPECENARKRVFRSGMHGRPPALPGCTDAPPRAGMHRSQIGDAPRPFDRVWRAELATELINW